MIADFLLVQKIRNGETIKQVISWLKSIILLSINIVIYILIIRNMRKIWYRKLLRDSSEH